MSLKKKVCVIGNFGVGKTSFVRCFVERRFAQDYLTTIGVSISRKLVELGGESVELIIWDVAGDQNSGSEEVFESEYLRGAQGVIVAVDGTQSSLLETAKKFLGSVPGESASIVIVTKGDLVPEEVHTALADELSALGKSVYVTSSLSDQNVIEAFHSLAEVLIHGNH